MSEVVLIIGIAILIAVFVVIRQFWTWYWKVNEALALLRGIRQDLAITNRQLAQLQSESTELRTTARSAE